MNAASQCGENPAKMIPSIQSSEVELRRKGRRSSPIDELSLLAAIRADVRLRVEIRSLDASLVEVVAEHHAKAVLLVLTDLPGVNGGPEVVLDVRLRDGCMKRRWLADGWLS